MRVGTAGDVGAVGGQGSGNWIGPGRIRAREREVRNRERLDGIGRPGGNEQVAPVGGEEEVADVRGAPEIGQ